MKMDVENSLVPPSAPAGVRYGLAVVFVLLATLGQYFTTSHLHDPNVYTVFWLGVIASALYGGFGPGLFALLLGGVLAQWLFVSSLSSPLPSLPSEWVQFGAFVCSGSVICAVCERRLHADRERLISLHNEQEARRREQESLEALRESEARLKATFEQAAVGIGMVSLDGRWLQVNERLCEIVGYTREELLAATFQAITYPEDLAADLRLVQQLINGDIPHFALEKRYCTKAGTVVWVNLTVGLVRDKEGQPAYFVSVVEDVNARKLAEATVQELARTLEQKVEERTRQLQDANTQLEAFSYSISHDLRAPLRAMQGFSRALDEDYGDALDEMAHAYLERISSSAGQMDTLINDLLAYSRLSRVDILLEPVPLEGVLREALIQADAEKRAVVTIQPPLYPVMANRMVLQQVLINLLTNAIKFVPDYLTPRIVLRSEKRGSWVRLCVQDNGIGIEPEYHERIFRVFERLHGEETYSGTGIGLAIVKKGVERMGGAVGLESAPEQGSTFWIELPAAEER